MQKPNTWILFSSLLIIGTGIGWLIGLSISPVVSIVVTSITGAAAALIAALGGLNNVSSETKEGQSSQALPNPQWRISPEPLACLIVGIILGTVVGLAFRNNGLLGTDLSLEINKWTRIDPSLNKEDLTKRLFALQYPPTPTPVSLPTWIGKDFSSAETKKALTAEVGFWEQLGLEKAIVAQKLFDLKYGETLPASSTPQADAKSSNGNGNPLTNGATITVLNASVSAEDCSKLKAVDPSILQTEMQKSDNVIVRLLAFLEDEPAELRKALTEVACVD